MSRSGLRRLVKLCMLQQALSTMKGKFGYDTFLLLKNNLLVLVFQRVVCDILRHLEYKGGLLRKVVFTVFQSRFHIPFQNHFILWDSRECAEYRVKMVYQLFSEDIPPAHPFLDFCIAESSVLEHSLSFSWPQNPDLPSQHNLDNTHLLILQSVNVLCLLISFCITQFTCLFTYGIPPVQKTVNSQRAFIFGFVPPAWNDLYSGHLIFVDLIYKNTNI